MFALSMYAMIAPRRNSPMMIHRFESTVLMVMGSDQLQEASPLGRYAFNRYPGRACPGSVMYAPFRISPSLRMTYENDALHHSNHGAYTWRARRLRGLPGIECQVVFLRIYWARRIW